MNEHKQALEANYNIGNYGKEYCFNCRRILEYSEIEVGICEECNLPNQE